MFFILFNISLQSVYNICEIPQTIKHALLETYRMHVPPGIRLPDHDGNIIDICDSKIRLPYISVTR